MKVPHSKDLLDSKTIWIRKWLRIAKTHNGLLADHDLLRTYSNPLWTKLVEVIGFQLSYFKSLNMMLLKYCTHFASKFEKLSSGHRTGKGQFSFQSQRKAMPKNVQTTTPIALISNASKVMDKILQVRLQQYMNQELPDVQAGFRKARGTRSICQHPLYHWKSKRIPEKHLLYWLCQSL